VSDDTPRQKHAGIRSSVGRPGPEHEALWRLIQETIAGALEERLPTLATVTGRSDEADDTDPRNPKTSGNVRVRLDDEDTDRKVAFPRVKGQRFNRGDRVVVMPSKAGEMVVLGGVTAGVGANAEQAVGNEHLIDGSVNKRKLERGAVDRDVLAPSAVGTTHLQDSAVDNTNIKSNAVDDRTIKPGGVKKTNLENSVQNSLGKADSAVQKNDLSGYAKKSDIPKPPDLSQYAKASDLKAIKEEITVIKRVIKRLQEDVAKKKRT
jgi:hypothetical protein